MPLMAGGAGSRDGSPARQGRGEAGCIGGKDVHWGCTGSVAHAKRWPYHNDYIFIIDAAAVNSGAHVDSSNHTGFNRVDQHFPFQGD